ncbi:TIGR04423 family type III CRISPR-associated protein [Campylobacter sp. CCUG 57310]|uniref:TIGR04423 family type III CRISPR-associated protein n=1 Tax=Campylobacter sp. CCUG 57310 TaxID=2517362 RepID=UPI001563A767|nr:TIGR04423 family type III CRISPR-associated protein [Campylobacter sp. CCUG 57310]QKF92725.1 CRISPR/Cas system-associated protein, type III (TIGR04423 family) [Campylobacter sp. CCUG 57310]
MRKTKDEILNYIKSLDGYEGYIQKLGSKISEDDIFFKRGINVNLQPNEYIYEAHFFSKNENKSILIRQINDSWIVDEVDLSKINLKNEDNLQEFWSKFGLKIKMAQIWEEENDELCEGLPVFKLKKAVFAGFADDEKDER